MYEPITYVGIDAHRRELHVAMLVGRADHPVTWVIPNEPRAVHRLARTLLREAPGVVEICYEAGPGGYALQRQLTRDRLHCRVIAPALMPRTPGVRIKTDRRDARKLAELLRAGLLTEVVPPTPEEEAVRDLGRARDDAQRDLQRARHRLDKLLLRRGLLYPRRNWTRGHRQWLNALTWTFPAERYVVEDYLLAIDHLEARLLDFDARIAEIAAREPYREPVGWLRCFHGVDTLSAVLLIAELREARRFPSARALMAYVGVIPSEYSSGDQHRRGRITKAGNALVRRILIEAAWHYRHRARVGRALMRRRLGQPAGVIAIADKAQQRLCRRFNRLMLRRVPAPKIAVAVARELAGFVWAVLQHQTT